MGDCSGSDRYPRVVIDDVEYPHDPGTDDPFGCIDLPPFVRGWCFESLPGPLRAFVRLSGDEPVANHDSVDRCDGRDPIGIIQVVREVPMHGRCTVIKACYREPFTFAKNGFFDR